jgi:uncharacterized protein (TIGR00251 family)
MNGEKQLEVKIKAVPQKGKANKEIINEFSKITNSPVEILSGHKSHHKTLKIYGIKENDLLDILKHYFYSYFGSYQNNLKKRLIIDKNVIS